MYQYVESENLQALQKLTAQSRTAFALLCAWRLLPAYQLFHERTGMGDARTLATLADMVRHHLSGSPSTMTELERAFEQCIALAPGEEPWLDETQAYADDAAAALAYAIRCAISSEVQDSAWASRRAYEAMDYFAGTLLGSSAGYDESNRLSHVAVQAELARQQRDLRELAAMESNQFAPAKLDALFHRATVEREAIFMKNMQSV